MNAVLDHTHSLALYTYNKMSAMKHTSGNPLCKIYCKTDFKNKSQQGPIINFNVLRANGDFVGYSEVLKNCFLYIIKTRLVSHFFSKNCQSTVSQLCYQNSKTETGFLSYLLLPCNKLGLFTLVLAQDVVTGHTRFHNFRAFGFTTVFLEHHMIL